MQDLHSMLTLSRRLNDMSQLKHSTSSTSYDLNHRSIAITPPSLPSLPQLHPANSHGLKTCLHRPATSNRPKNPAPTAPSSPLFNLLTTSLRTDPTTQVVGGVGSGLRPAIRSPLQSRGGGGGRGQALRVLARFCLPRRVPSRVPRRVPRLTSTLRGTRCG